MLYVCYGLYLDPRKRQYLATILELAMICDMKPSERVAVTAIQNRLPWENAKDIAKRIGFSASTVRNAACASGLSLRREQPNLDTIKHFVTHRESGCWEWQFCRNDAGYGQFRLNGRIVYVHRHIWELFHQKKATGFICHKCDNPPCCNPDHLFLGNGSLNILDAKSKGRHKQQGYNVKLNAEQVAQIRALYATRGVTQRELGATFNVCHQTITQIVNGRTWKLQ